VIAVDVEILQLALGIIIGLQIVSIFWNIWKGAV